MFLLRQLPETAQATTWLSARSLRRMMLATARQRPRRLLLRTRHHLSSRAFLPITQQSARTSWCLMMPPPLTTVVMSVSLSLQRPSLEIAEAHQPSSARSLRPTIVATALLRPRRFLLWIRRLLSWLFQRITQPSVTKNSHLMKQLHLTTVQFVQRSLISRQLLKVMA